MLELVYEGGKRWECRVSRTLLHFARRPQQADPRPLLLRGRQRADHRVGDLHDSARELGATSPLDQRGRLLGLASRKPVARCAEVVTERPSRPAVKLAHATLAAPPEEPREQEITQEVMYSGQAGPSHQR